MLQAIPDTATISRDVPRHPARESKGSSGEFPSLVEDNLPAPPSRPEVPAENNQVKRASPPLKPRDTSRPDDGESSPAESESSISADATSPTAPGKPSKVPSVSPVQASAEASASELLDLCPAKATSPDEAKDDARSAVTAVAANDGSLAAPLLPVASPVATSVQLAGDLRSDASSIAVASSAAPSLLKPSGAAFMPEENLHEASDQAANVAAGVEPKSPATLPSFVATGPKVAPEPSEGAGSKTRKGAGSAVPDAAKPSNTGATSESNTASLTEAKADAVAPPPKPESIPDLRSSSITHEHRSAHPSASVNADTLVTTSAAAGVSIQQLAASAPEQMRPAPLVAPSWTAPQHSVPINGLAVELAGRLQNGVTRFEVRLDPADLGRIDVRIDIDRQGQVTSHLTVEKPETLAMLRLDSPQLHRALNEAGLKTADGALQFSLGDQSQPRNHADSAERQAQRFMIRDDDSAAIAAPVRGYGRMFAARGGIDISV